MNDIKILEDMLAGFEEKGKELRAKESLFIKSQGLDETIERNIMERDDLEGDVALLKSDLKALKDQKNTALMSVGAKICEKLNDFLPIGEAFFDASEAFSFGWVYNDVKQSYNSLSGGQKSIFDAALGHLLGSNIQIIEAGEIDEEHLSALLEDLKDSKKQIFVNSWFDKITVPKEFEVVKIK